MKKLFTLLFLSIMVSITFAQVPVKDTSAKNCHFLNSLHFMNGKAIIKTEAIYCALFEAPPIYAMQGFEKHRTLLNTRIYSGAEFSFIPKGCSEKYNAPFTAKQGCCSFKIGSTVYLTCIVFKNYRSYDSKYFFVVSGLSLKDPNKKVTPKMK